MMRSFELFLQHGIIKCRITTLLHKHANDVTGVTAFHFLLQVQGGRGLDCLSAVVVQRMAARTRGPCGLRTRW